MSSLARKLQEQQSQERQHVTKPERKRALWHQVTPGEKLIWVLFAALLCFGAVQIVTAQSAIYKVNKDIQEVKTSINDQERVNADLKVQVKELSKYDRIMLKAKEHGLNLNENNVKVVQ
ncbi:cell division protein FtsL [Neobacillus notoginsengisoli]|uniref:Cell division protein FtsL n=1 Tax=Neobacillus notoginsengisoli TaxID=1578198 RepID=A0A417YQZ1_9BACI|nr:cell division protein FtsL [Neobacillus notoginsengisoli]RHW36504.1 cell division protein FtsL [Neobacillus notoginsengisoli]